MRLEHLLEIQRGAFLKYFKLIHWWDGFKSMFQNGGELNKEQERNASYGILAIRTL